MAKHRPADPQQNLIARALSGLQAGERSFARKLLDEILAKQPAHAEALFHRAVVAAADERPEQAAGFLARCCDARPDWAEAQLRLGQASLLINDLPTALVAFRVACALTPNDLRAFEGLAETLRRDERDFAALVQARKRLAELDPGNVERFLLLGFTLRRGDLSEASTAVYQHALQLQPDHPVARWALLQNPPTAVPADAQAERDFAEHWSQGLAWFESLDVRRYPPRQIEQTLLNCTDFALHYQPGPLLAERCRYADVLARLAHAAIPAPPLARRPPGSRRRIALVSACFRRHSVTKVLGGLLRALDAQRFEVGVFHLDPRADAETAAWRAFAARYVQLPQRPADWLAAIAEFAADGVVYLDIGMDPLSQVLACYRLAPVQIALWGHPLTTGHSRIDYFFSADLTEAADPTSHYREAVLRLPHLGTSYSAPIRQTHEVRNDGTVQFLLAQMVLKITPAHDQALARIAAGLPQARFTILPSHRAHVCEALAARLRRAFDARGLDFDRQVRVTANRPEAQFLALAASMDVNLDTFGWSGGVSTFDLVGQGLPTVTIEGDTLRGRQSSAILRRAGVTETICTDVDTYVETAIALGRDADLRTHLRERLLAARERVFDDPVPAKAFADCLEKLLPRP